LISGADRKNSFKDDSPDPEIQVGYISAPFSPCLIFDKFYLLFKISLDIASDDVDHLMV